MSGEIVFYTHPMSRGRIVRWMLEEIGCPYRTELLEFGTTMRSAAYLAVNPMGKVPALRHGGTVITETGAICAHLADAFPAAGLAPAPGDPARGAWFRWMFFAAGPLEAAILDKALGLAPPADKRGMVGYGSFDAVLDVLEAELGSRDYLVGGRFTAADLYLGSTLGWAMMFGAVPKRPAFEGYWARLAARPAAIRAREIDDKLLPPKPQAGT